MDKSFLENIAVKKQEQKQQAEKDDNRRIQLAQTDLMNRTTIDAFKTLVKFLDKHQPTVKFGNKDYSKSEDISQLVESIDELNETNFLSQQTVATELSDKLEALGKSIAELGKKQTSPEVRQNFTTIVDAIKSNDKVSITNLADLAKYFDKLNKTLSSIKLDPTIEVKPTEVNVEKPDLEPLLKELRVVAKEIGGIRVDGPTVNVDTNSDKDAVAKVETAIKNIEFPIPNYVLPFTSNGKATQANLTSDGKILTGNGLIPVEFDRLTFSNADGNGNYQTGTVKKSGSTVGTLTLAYDGSSNLTDIHFT